MRFRTIPLFLISLFVPAASSAEILSPMPRAGFDIIDIPPGYDSREAISYFVTGGNETQTLQVSLDAPDGVTFVAESQNIDRGESVSGILKSDQGWNRERFLTEEGTEASSFVPTSEVPIDVGTDGSTGTPEDPIVCGSLHESDIRRLIEDTAGLGINLTKERLCEMLGVRALSASPMALSGFKSSSGRMMVRKDACSLNRRSRQVVRLRLNTARVDPALKAQGYSIRVSARPQPYRGNKAASLKPVSEGRFAPQPLFLMTSLNGFGKQRLNIVEWNRGKVRRVRTVNTADFVYHRGKLLTRTPAGKFMSGKKATVELTNGREMYSVCFTLARRRQNVNGYK